MLVGLSRCLFNVCSYGLPKGVQKRVLELDVFRVSATPSIVATAAMKHLPHVVSKICFPSLLIIPRHQQKDDERRPLLLTRFLWFVSEAVFANYFLLRAGV